MVNVAFLIILYAFLTKNFTINFDLKFQTSIRSLQSLHLHKSVSCNSKVLIYYSSQRQKMPIHEGVKYSCNQCDSNFSKQSNLNRHKMSVHEGFKYYCIQCDYIFSWQSSLKTQKMSVHEGVKFSFNLCDSK